MGEWAKTTSVREGDQPNRVTRAGLGDLHPGAVEPGIRVRLHDANGEDVGFAHAPPPLTRGDTLALADGSTWRVLGLIDVTRLDTSPLFDMSGIDRVVDALCMVERIDL